MPWQAAEIMARGERRVLEALAGDERFAPFLYHLAEPLPFPHFVRRGRHSLPPNGLAVVRPPDGALRQDRDPWAWFPAPAVAAQATAPALEFPPERIMGHDPASEVGDLPFVHLLGSVKALSARLHAPMIVCFCATWGGPPVEGYAWVFTHEEYVLIADQQAVDPPGRVYRHDALGRVRMNEGLLQAALSPLGLYLPSDYFLPHTRGFPGERYKV